MSVRAKDQDEGDGDCDSLTGDDDDDDDVFEDASDGTNQAHPREEGRLTSSNLEEQLQTKRRPVESLSEIATPPATWNRLLPQRTHRRPSTSSPRRQHPQPLLR